MVRLCSLLLVLSMLMATPALAVTISFDQCSNCGNPGQALQVFVGGLNPNTGAAIGFVNQTFSWDPAIQGAIASIDASVDKDVTLSQSTPFSGSFGNNFRPLIEQDGKFYLAQILGPTLPVSNQTSATSGYVHISGTGLLATSFGLYDFTTGTLDLATNPNFSGDPMLFGLASVTTISSTAQLSNATLEIDFDNLSLTVNDPTFTDGTFNLTDYRAFEFLSPVPEPSTIFLLGSGFIGLAAYGKKKFFKA